MSYSSREIAILKYKDLSFHLGLSGWHANKILKCGLVEGDICYIGFCKGLNGSLVELDIKSFNYN